MQSNDTLIIDIPLGSLADQLGITEEALQEHSKSNPEVATLQKAHSHTVADIAARKAQGDIQGATSVRVKWQTEVARIKEKLKAKGPLGSSK